MARSVEIKVDLNRFMDVLDKQLTIEVAEDIADKARSLVAVDSGELYDSIELESFGSTLEVVAEAPHATAQEYGRPDLPNYRFKPYMRPAVMAVAAAPQKDVEEATRKAISASRK